MYSFVQKSSVIPTFYVCCKEKWKSGSDLLKKCANMNGNNVSTFQSSSLDISCIFLWKYSDCQVYRVVQQTNRTFQFSLISGTEMVIFTL